MQELNQEPPHTTAIDTNAEYILPNEAKKQPPVLLSVSKAIIVETVKDFFRSIFGFFWRYIKHFGRCLVYFVNPSLQKKPFDKLDFKENSQHAFEFVIIVLAVLIFMIKVGWIPETQQELFDIYSNDLLGKVAEITFFIVLALCYLLLAALSVLFGRLFRMMFGIKITRHESDILFVYLHNAFFSITAIIALVLRSSASLQTHDEDSIFQFLAIMVVPAIFIPLVIWCVRFAYLQKLNFLKGSLFFLLGIIFSDCFILPAALL